MQKCFVHSRFSQLFHWVHQVEHRTQAGDKREIQLGPQGPGPPAPQHPARQACPGADLWSLFISFSHFSGLWSLTQVCPIPCFRQEGRAERPLKASGPWDHSSNRCGLQACFLLGRRPEQQGGGAPHAQMNLWGKMGQILHAIQAQAQVPWGRDVRRKVIAIPFLTQRRENMKH